MKSWEQEGGEWVAGWVAEIRPLFLFSVFPKVWWRFENIYVFWEKFLPFWTVVDSTGVLGLKSVHFLFLENGQMDVFLDIRKKTTDFWTNGFINPNTEVDI